MIFWSEDNAAKFVIAVMRILLRYVALKEDRGNIVAAAHTEAEKAKTVTQAQYDLAFATALRTLLLKAQVPAQELTDEALLDSQAPQAQRLSVATDEVPAAPPAAAPPRDPNDRSKWTVADWQAAGISFRPAAFHVAPELTRTLQKPELEKRHRRSQGDYTNGAEEAPWGLRAVVLAKWVLEKHPSGPLTQQTVGNLAEVLSYLYYAGLMKEGSIMPLGQGHQRVVRPKKQKG